MTNYLLYRGFAVYACAQFDGATWVAFISLNPLSCSASTFAEVCLAPCKDHRKGIFLRA